MFLNFISDLCYRYCYNFKINTLPACKYFLHISKIGTLDCFHTFTFLSRKYSNPLSTCNILMKVIKFMFLWSYVPPHATHLCHFLLKNIRLLLISRRLYARVNVGCRVQRIGFKFWSIVSLGLSFMFFNFFVLKGNVEKGV